MGSEESGKVNNDLRRDLRALQQTQRNMEVERSDLARQLADEKRQLEFVCRACACAQPSTGSAIHRVGVSVRAPVADGQLASASRGL